MMKEVTRNGELNRYYMYKGLFITRDWHNGLYSTYTSNGRIMADTQKGIMKLINKQSKCK